MLDLIAVMFWGLVKIVMDKLMCRFKFSNFHVVSGIQMWGINRA
jgi:hypothetical protein